MKIKFISGILCLAALFVACQQKQATGYTIDGTLKGAPDGAIVRLVDPYIGEEATSPFAEGVIKNEKFTLKGSVEYPTAYLLVINMTEPGKEKGKETLLASTLYVENAPIQWEADAATLTSYYYNPERKGKPTVKGSAQQALYEGFLDSEKSLTEKLGKLNDTYMKEYYTPLINDVNANVIERGIELVDEIEPLRKKRLQNTIRYITEHPETRVAFDEAEKLFRDIYQVVTAKQMDEIVAALEPAWGQTSLFGEFKKISDRAKLMAVGEKIPNHDFLTPDGKTVKLSSVIPQGKYVLLDFWASWCGPCRGGIPHLKNVKKKYPDFNIVNISVDKDSNEWHKALDEEKMPWTQLRFPSKEGEKQPVESDSANLIYGITGVPVYIILDGEGRILKPEADWANLDKFLKETYGK